MICHLSQEDNCDQQQPTTEIMILFKSNANAKSFTAFIIVRYTVNFNSHKTLANNIIIKQNIFAIMKCCIKKFTTEFIDVNIKLLTFHSFF